MFKELLCSSSFIWKLSSNLSAVAPSIELRVLFSTLLLWENKFSEYPVFLFWIRETIFKTVLFSVLCPSSAVATIDTLILPVIFSSLIAPNISSASGSTSALILFTDWSTSNNVRSFPPVILINNPFAPWREYSSIKGLFKAISVAIIALFSPSASPVPIIALPIELITVSTSAKSRFIIPGLTIKSVTLCTPCFKTLLDKLNDSSNVVVSLAILNKFWLGTTITVSKCLLNSSSPSIALLILFGPS